MLLELNIENYAVIEKLRVRFHPGLNLLTGETGSGKSIVVDALALLFGARAAKEVIRPGARRARIAGVFEVHETDELAAVLSESGVEMEDGELIVEREVLESGKSRAYVSGRVVTLGYLRQLAPVLGDIHGQHEQQSLFRNPTQLAMLDTCAGVSREVEEVSRVYADWRASVQQLEQLRGSEQERLRLLDLYRFQDREISEGELDPEEPERLASRAKVMANLARVEEKTALAYDALYDAGTSALSQLSAAQRAVEELLSFDAGLSGLAERLAAAKANIEDVAFELRDYRDRFDSDPKALERVEDRLALIEKLKRKYGETVEEVVAYGREVRGRLEEIESSDAQIGELEQKQGELAARYEMLAQALSKKRRAAAARLQGRVEKELRSLAMEKARFEIGFEEDDNHWSATGIDRVGFLVSANPGQPPRPLAQVASGGELSRITLALKTCLLPDSKPAGKKSVPRTLVFDEIDSGVGGRVAESLGERLKQLSRHHQVLCVTHLPQVAGFADAHYFVDKQERNQQTFASVTELGKADRVTELARMISGAKVTAAAVEHAQEMLKPGRKAG